MKHIELIEPAPRLTGTVCNHLRGWVWDYVDERARRMADQLYLQLKDDCDKTKV